MKRGWEGDVFLGEHVGQFWVGIFTWYPLIFIVSKGGFGISYNVSRVYDVFTGAVALVKMWRSPERPTGEGRIHAVVRWSEPLLLSNNQHLKIFCCEFIIS